MKRLAADVLLSLAAVGVMSLLIGGVLSLSQIGNLTVLYIPGVLWLAARRGRRAAVLASAAAFLVYDWFFVPPFHTLEVGQPQEWISLAVLLVVALVTGESSALLRRQSHELAEHDRHTQLLYDISTQVTVPENLGEQFDRMLATLASGLDLAAARLYVWRDGQRELSGAAERPPADWSRLPGAVHCLPCRIGSTDLAELEVVTAGELRDDDLRVLRGFANQLANALERRRLEKEEQLNRVLAESDRAKSSLLAAVSHDLRTPLAAIKASATSLLQPQAPFDEGTRRDFLAAINSEADRLDRLVRNLLDMSRIESGALAPRLEWHNLSEIAADVIDRLQPVSNGHELQLLAEDREFLAQVDYVQLSQVLTNLVDNAIRHGAPGAPVRVLIADGRLSVENSGRQLSEDERAHMFERFYRGEGLASGTGLGLAIAKGVVEAHGGRIWAENTPGGVAFHVALREAAPEPEPRAEPLPA
jgi:two-component system sensor histidine kinase KdpD